MQAPPHPAHSQQHQQQEQQSPLHLGPAALPRPRSRSSSPFADPMQQYPSSQSAPRTALPPAGYSQNGAPRSQSPYPTHSQQQQQPPPPPPQDTRTQLFVSNLPFRVRWQDLKDLMRKCGTVLRADVALSPTDGRSRGFGVVLFARAEDAVKAIGVYHGYTWQTRVLDVRIDSQDPTGALALAEANRQQAIQQQREAYQNLASRMPSSMPPNLPPPPPVTQPLQHYTANGGLQHVPPPPLPPPTQSASSGTSPYLAPSHLSAQGHYVNQGNPPPLSSHSSPPTVLGGRESPHRNPTPLNALPRSSSADSVPSPSSSASQTQHPGASSSSAAPPAAALPLALEQSRSQSPRPGSSHSLPPAHFPPTHSLNSQPQVMIPLSLLQSLTAGVPANRQLGNYAGPPPPPNGMVPGGLMSFYNNHANGGAMNPMRGMSSQGMGPPGPGGQQGYTNRHLFIGNLPFNCQWQELKDLMRGAGSVLRADIAQGPDGRSRGFGSVLFATPIDAERAVQLFNGHEFQGRTLKVHFDKFSGAGVNGNPGYPNGGPYNNYGNNNSNGPYRPDPPQYPPYVQNQQNLNNNNNNYAAAPQQKSVENLAASRQLQQQQQQNSTSGPFNYGSLFPEGSGEILQREPSTSRPGTAQAPIGSPSPRVQSRDSQEVVHQSGDETRSLPDAESTDGDAAADNKSAKVSPSLLRLNTTAPSRIAMPPPLPFGGMNGGGPFSPMRTNLPPMTPSMPAFTFGGFSAPTPPVHPHALFSPGVGPFSPQIGSPFFGPGQAMGHFQTVAPGTASPGFGFNPMFPSFPPTPGPGHHQQQQHHRLSVQHEHHQPHQYEEEGYPINGSGPAPESGEGGDEQTTPQAIEPNDTAAAEASYFPFVAQQPSEPETSSSRPRLHESSSQPLTNGTTENERRRPVLPDLSVSDPLANDLKNRLNLDDTKSSTRIEHAGNASQGSLARGSNSDGDASRSISMGGIISQPGWAEEGQDEQSIVVTRFERPSNFGAGTNHFAPREQGRDKGDSNNKVERRKSFVPPVGTNESITSQDVKNDHSDRRGPVGGSSPGKLGVTESTNARRASFEDSTRKRPTFGTSIWG
ncbi:uncharacterized protein JCM15063_001719 [Sporobolomyces koalae]|uniref:uncharacterized protein n=1 Tax=Sporobolomyces koalae TaxID=500713 RepID=UPI0031700C7A